MSSLPEPAGGRESLVYLQTHSSHIAMSNGFAPPSSWLGAGGALGALWNGFSTCSSVPISISASLQCLEAPHFSWGGLCSFSAS
jgi:hypothetical protein